MYIQLIYEHDRRWIDVNGTFEIWILLLSKSTSQNCQETKLDISRFTGALRAMASRKNSGTPLKTNESPLERGHLKRKGSSSNHYFSEKHVKLWESSIHHHGFVGFFESSRHSNMNALWWSYEVHILQPFQFICHLFPSSAFVPTSGIFFRRKVKPNCLIRQLFDEKKHSNPAVGVSLYQFLDVPTLHKTNIAPENRPSQKETSIFQPSIFRCRLLVSGRVW